MRLFVRRNNQSKLKRELTELLGFKPKDLSFYRLAFIDPALRNEDDPNRIETNDRLEFLGDSILGMLVSKYLYQEEPLYPVGKLSSLKSHIVSRQVSNTFGEKLGLPHFIEKKEHVLYGKDFLGNALEALIAAIYLDRGIDRAEEFVTKKLLPLYRELRQEGSDLGRNFKGELQLWTDKEARKVKYETSSNGKGKGSHFTSRIFIDDKVWGEGEGSSKKQAEQAAAHEVLRKLGKVKVN